jgi:nucleotide-binding universal stress UspA family protein
MRPQTADRGFDLMIQARKILVAMDFSPCSESALRFGFDFAERMNGELHVLNATQMNGGRTARTSPAARSANGSAKAGPGSIGQLRVRHVLVADDDPARAILTYAEREDIDLIILGRHGRRGLRRLLLGSVSHETTRLAACPVLIVPELDPVAQGALERILCPVDFSDHSFRALQHAEALSKSYHAALSVLHVVETPEHVPSFYRERSTGLVEADEELLERARAELRRLYERVGTSEAPEVDSEAEIQFESRSGHAAVEIIDYAQRRSIDMVVLATHGLSGLRRFFVGSVADRIIRSVSCPVLLVKAFGKSLVS